jgi:hypothetical protein
VRQRRLPQVPNPLLERIADIFLLLSHRTSATIPMVKQ